MAPPAILALEDGGVWRGQAFGAPGTAAGEVCFNTSMAGYQEVLTDPSYHGQIVAMTAPHIGVTGVNSSDEQSHRPWAAGFITRSLTGRPSSWRSTGSLADYLEGHGVPGLTEIDTRRLTRHLRTKGAMRGAISSEITDPGELVDLARASRRLVGADLAREAGAPNAYRWRPPDPGDPGEARLRTESFPAISPPGRRPEVAAFDFGMKRNQAELLTAAGCEVTVVPGTTTAETVLAGGYEGVFLSNGPGDPEPVIYGIETVRALLGRLPIFGVCLGHQILALALGARTFKLPFGHRGANHPVGRAGGGPIEITSQNHVFAVDAASLGATPARLSHVNLNDGTVEGLEVPGLAYSVQYHPEAGPGPHDSRYLFTRFRDLIGAFEPAELELQRG
ncbi:MAG: glutamine-hydrolyzing carbamoyl-phosphate synthase small subunit [Actinobacteria bacterium]|nr:glutamine-hydrolyzing carbamoyl-phosphate synthase small subunit [Actinomycetota bacterium]